MFQGCLLIVIWASLIIKLLHLLFGNLREEPWMIIFELHLWWSSLNQDRPLHDWEKNSGTKKKT